MAASNGGIVRLEAGMPDIRLVREGRPAAGRGWIGIVPRGAYETGDIQVTEFLPAWLWLMLAAVPSGLMLSTTTHLTTDLLAMPPIESDFSNKVIVRFKYCL